MKKLKIVMLAALCGFSFCASASNLYCYNPSPDMQVCTGDNGYSVTCTKIGNFVTCTGSDGKTTTMYQN